MPQPNRSRRRYLTSALPTAALLSVGGWPWLAKAKAAAPASFALANLLRLAPQPQAALIGAAVLPQLAHPAPQALVQALVSRLSAFLGHDLHQVCDTGQLHLAFQEAVQADFAQGKCQSVSGWVLTRTEVELCALAALSANQA